MSRMLKIWPLMALILIAGCGKESTRPKDDGEPGKLVVYFPLSAGSEWRYRVLHPAYDSVGTASLAILGTFTAESFSGYVALDSSLFGMDTLWIVASPDTVSWLFPRSSYAERRPILLDHSSQADFSWQMYSVGTPGTGDRYSVILRQGPGVDTVISSRGEIYTNCIHTDLLAVYEQSGDTVLLGSEYFARDIGRVLSTFRPFVESSPYMRELIR